MHYIRRCVYYGSPSSANSFADLKPGISRTWLEKFGGSGASGRTTATQTVSDANHSGKIPFLKTEQFLRLVQPIDESSYPVPRVASGTHTFPFTFVIPSQLLPTACSMKPGSPAVQAAHLQVPPSLGDRAPGDHNDDMAPDMARISYNIRARINRRRESDNSSVCIISTTHAIHVRPTVEEAPPMHIYDRSGDYILRKEKDLRKGLLGKRIGRLTVSAPEPKPMHLSTNRVCPATTTVPVELTFTPTEPLVIPPPLGTVTTKLRTSTFFSTTHTSYIPTPSRTNLDPQVGHYNESMLLSSRCMANTRWEPMTDPATDKLMYKAILNIPVAEPKDKPLVPSFSTCYITRSYRLDLSVSVHTSTHSQPSLSLKLPLQVVMPSKISREEQAALMQQGVDEFFTPRSVAPPPAWSSQAGPSSRLQTLPPTPPASPPQYSMFGGRVSHVPVRIPEPVGISPGCG